VKANKEKTPPHLVSLSPCKCQVHVSRIPVEDMQGGGDSSEALATPDSTVH
jgi:hypothetical protein